MKAIDTKVHAWIDQGVQQMLQTIMDGTNDVLRKLQGTIGEDILALQQRQQEMMQLIAQVLGVLQASAVAGPLPTAQTAWEELWSAHRQLQNEINARMKKSFGGG